MKNVNKSLDVSLSMFTLWKIAIDNVYVGAWAVWLRPFPFKALVVRHIARYKPR